MKLSDTTADLLFKHAGTCQAERLSPQLINNSPLIDEKALDEHMVFVYLYSDLIKYYNSQNESFEHNVWRGFLENDDTVILSLILQTDLTKLTTTIRNNLLRLKKEKIIVIDNRYCKQLFDALKDLMLLMSYWYKNLSRFNQARLAIYNFITNELNKGISVLYYLLKQDDAHHGSVEILVKFYAFVEHMHQGTLPWALKPVLINQDFLPAETTQHTFNHLTGLFNSIFNKITHLKILSAKIFPKTITSQQHQPHLALLIAFVRLMGYVTEQLNYITQRHLDFYYRRVLKFKNKPVTPDKVNVYFELEDDTPKIFLKKGIQLSAGKDEEGNDILFEVEKSVTLNHVTLNKIHIIQQAIQDNSRHKALSKGNITMATYMPAELNEDNVLAFRKLNNPKDQEDILQKFTEGLVIASPILNLKEGKRAITFAFQFSERSFKTFMERCVTLSQKNQEEIKNKLLPNLFKEAIHVQFTTEEAWLTLAKKNIVVSVSKSISHCVEIKLLLDSSVPPIVNFNQTIHGDAYHTNVPAIRLVLSATTLLGQIALLRNLTLEKVHINVDVKDYRSAILQNDLGLIDTNQPFEPFGPMPKLYANFYIGSDEIFSKTLSQLRLNIAWQDLPTLDGGFEYYYAAYPEKVTNSSFRVNVAYLNHRQWYPLNADEREKIPIFSAEDESTGSQKLHYKSVIQGIDFEKLGITKQNYVLDPPLLTKKTLTGFIKLQLSSPTMAFGHALYPSLASEILTHNVMVKDKTQKITEPNKPYTPLIKSFSIDYKAKETIDFTSIDLAQDKKDDINIFSLLPFGYKKIFPNTSSTLPAFIPKVDHAGVLFLGFQNVYPPTPLSLYIQLDEKSGTLNQSLPTPSWQYLSNDIWINFKEDEMISDTTNNFTKSGIIEFNIPERASKDHTLLDPGFVWIQAIFSNNLDALPDIIGMYTQAARALRMATPTDQEQASLAPPNAIQNIVNSPPGIKSITQPFESFGGAVAEDDTKFYTRVSERLRHKYRAISVWDYERMVLEKFPEIFRAKCINHSKISRPFLPTPGSIVMVIVYGLKHNNAYKESIPKTSNHILEKIKRYLQQFASPFIDIEVVNPLYEEVSINVEVKFKEGYDKGIFLNKLQKELKALLSPWLFKPAEDIKLGGIIPSSKILDFISKREYIEGVGKFSILKYTDKEDNLNITKVGYDNYLRATYPWSMMISTEKHEIFAVDEIQRQSTQGHEGVSNMGVGKDLIVGPWKKIGEQRHQFEATAETLQESLEEYYLVTKKHIKQT